MTYTNVCCPGEEPGLFNLVIAMVNALSINWVILYNVYKKRLSMNPMDERKEYIWR